MTNETLADILDEIRSDEAASVLTTGLLAHEMKQQLNFWADRIEAAAKREIPQPDPNWKDICAKCADGDIEPHFCAYYGEPNGCNSPIYGEHPSAAKSSGFGNAVAMHSCLVKILAEMLDLGGMKVGRVARFSPDAVADEISAALAVPARNCDRFSRGVDAVSAYYEKGGYPITVVGCDFADWLFAPAGGGEK